METSQLPMPVHAGALSEAGRRDQNQDRMAAFSSPFGAVYMVADGMGGHKGGAVAAQMVVDGFERHLNSLPPNTMPAHSLALASRLTNAEVVERGSSGDHALAGMGSTMAVALIRDLGTSVEMITAHVGDSRVYVHRQGKLIQKTEDHTQVRALVRAKIIGEEEARHHPDASVLTRAMGQSTELTIEISEAEPLFDGDGILICSDGLSGFATDEAINRTILANPEPTECAKSLYDLAMASGSSDNITVQFVRVGTSPEPVALPAPPSRQTQPDQVAAAFAPPVPFPTPPSPAPPPERSNTFVLLLAGLLIGLAIAGGVGVFIFRDRLFPKAPAPVAPVVKHDPLKESVETLRSGAIQLDQKAREGVAAADELLKACTDLPETPKKQAALRAEQTKLETDIKQLRSQYEQIGDGARDLVNQVYRYRQEAAKPAKSTSQTGAASPNLQAEVSASMENLKKQEDELSQLQPVKDGLRAKLTDLQARGTSK